MEPDEVSQKSLKTLDRKLVHLAKHARFHVNINSVIGAGMRNARDPLTIAEGRPNSWSCKAGSRYLYICEEGLVHYCSQQRGTPGTPLSEYTVHDIHREFHTEKPCAPYCTIGCVHRASALDRLRPSELWPLARAPRPPAAARPHPAADALATGESHPAV